MTSAILKMNACLQIEVGMEVFYDCPAMSMDSHESDVFFKKHRGKTGTIVGFGTKFVGLLDSKGRLPGVYYKSGIIKVQFKDEEDVHSLNINHFILVSEAKTTVPEISLENQRAGDLPLPIEFYPGDAVHKSDDLLASPRHVERVIIRNDGTLAYELSETEDARRAREAEVEAKKQKEREEAKARDHFMPSMAGMFSHPKTEVCEGNQLTLIAGGNVRYLYTDPSQMSFKNKRNELAFWAQDGISKTVYGPNRYGGMPTWEFSLKNAKKMVKDEEGDIVVASKQHKGVIVVGRSGDHGVRRLHSCFAEHRSHVKSISLRTRKPITEPERDRRRLAGALFD